LRAWRNTGAPAREAAENLGFSVIAAEDFGASPGSPQQVCLAGVRDADVVMLLLGERYGTPQRSGLSPTHEEYREARGKKPALIFVQDGVTREPDEENLVEEASGWEGGQYRQPFDSPASLRAAVTRALHQWELSPAGRAGERGRADIPRGSAATTEAHVRCGVAAPACRGGGCTSTAGAAAQRDGRSGVA
jgi:hypothetical protein